VLFLEGLLVMEGDCLFGLYLDDFGEIGFLVVFLFLYVLHEPLELGIDEGLLELVLMAVLGDELAGELLVFFMHGI
jgi:hypothetical protein